MKIIALTENTAARPDLGAEHGLSLYLEACGKKILFDTGQSPLFAENAAKLGVDLSAVDLAVLSHGHYDHSGGLKHFLEINDHAPIYVSRYAFEPHLTLAGKDIGVDPSLKNDPRLIPVGDKAEIAPGLTLYSCNRRKRLFPLVTGGMTTLRGGRSLPEDFRHEQYLLIEEDGKRILISGCSHKGILDIAAWFKPDILVGGFHFFRLPLDERLTSYARRLEQSGIRFYTCHCTGTAQYEWMKKDMTRLEYLSAGQQIEL